MAVDMNPRKIAQKFCPQDKAAAKRLREEAEAAKLILEAKCKDVHAIVIPSVEYDGIPRIDIGIQELTPQLPKSWNPITNLLNWALRQLEIKNKTPRTIGYVFPEGAKDFATKVIVKADELKREFHADKKAYELQREFFTESRVIRMISTKQLN